jgi:ABC-type dipeptide/oligopeptide/nickel transport system ATPase component
MVPDPYNRPTGCPFHTRCEQVIPGLCDRVVPQRTGLGQNRSVSCLLYEEAYAEAKARTTVQI